MTILFTDGFESGNFSAWTSTTGSPAISTLTHHGLYSAKMYMNTAGAIHRLSKTVNNADEYYCRTYVNIANKSSLLEMKSVGPRFGDSSNNLISYVGYIGPTSKWAIYMSPSGSTYQSSSVTINEMQWYCLEFRLRIGNPTGIAQLWVDGQLMVNAQNINCGTTQIGSAHIQSYTPSLESSTLYLYFDCFVVSDSYIGTQERTSFFALKKGRTT